jgi:hypothetical protein
MNFLRNLFGGSRENGTANDRNIMVFYVQPKRCDEVIEVRVHLLNELSLTEDGGYFVRKLVRGARCPFPAELHLSFDSQRRLLQVGVQDGANVDEAAYQNWVAKRTE